MTLASSRRRGWPKGVPKPITGLRSAFPSDALRADLRRLGLSAAAAARAADIVPSRVSQWLRHKQAPQARTLRRFLEALGLDEAPYRRLLQPMHVRLVCPCGKRRLLRRAALTQAGHRASGRTALRQLDEDTFERLCRACYSRQHGLAIARKVNARKLRGLVAKPVIELAAQGNTEEKKIVSRAMLSLLGGPRQLAANRARFREFVRRPKTEEHRRAISRGHIRAAVATRPFRLCPLCELVTYSLRWHRECWYTWLRWCFRELGRRPTRAMLPPPSRHRGPKPEANIGRNYAWLIARRGGIATRRRLVTAPGSSAADRTTVTKATQSLLDLLPGSWSLVFSNPSNGNDARQELVPLPLELQPLIGRGDRDRLIGRLLRVGMSHDAIVRVTGPTLYRVRGVADRQTTETA